jgi:pimeloyl-ACP methyl ester carboxylesterase
MTTASASSLEHLLERWKREAESGVCDTGRYRSSYHVWGAGPPLVFLHGMADRSISFAPLMAVLSDEFRCIAYDLPTGQEDGARLSRYTHSDLTQDLFVLLDHLKLRQSYVFGASFGATIALAAAHARPDRVPRLALREGFAHRRLAKTEILAAGLSRHLRIPLRHLPGHEAIMRRMLPDGFPSRAPEVWHFLVSNTGDIPLSAVACRALLVHELDLRPILGDVHQPVLLLGGDREPLLSVGNEEDQLDALPNAGRTPLEDCGRFAHLTHPEAVASVIRRFLTPSCSSCPL